MRFLLNRWHQKRGEFVDKQKEGKKCLRCGEADVICLDFHHIDPSKKISEVRTLARNTANNDLVLKEIAKCILLCSNCHRREHAKRL